MTELTAELDAPPSPPATPEDTEAFKALSRLVRDMGDGLDHPELWPLLAEVVTAGEADELFDVLRNFRVLQPPKVARIFDVVEGLMLALGKNREEGLSLLRRLEGADGLCPQIAGALFYATHFGSADRPPHLEGKFCPAPFEKFETLVDGTVAPCCSLWTKKRLGKLGEHNFDQIWNSKDAQDMRASILDGSFRHCNKRRCTYIVDNTLPDRSAIADSRLKAIIDREGVVLDDHPRTLALAHDWTCNLACPSCRGGIFGANEEQERRFEIIEHDVFRPILNAKNEVHVSIAGQGDPWSSPHYKSLLRYLADRELNVQLVISTNALLMTPARWEQFSGLQKYRCAVNVSIDACTPWVYKVVRFPGTWEKLEPNLKFIAEKRKAGDFFAFDLNATIQLDNFHEMGELVSYARRTGADALRLYMIQNTGSHLAFTYAHKNVAAPDHPLHLAFLETLRDPRLAAPPAHLYDVASLRQLSLNTDLPSDRLPLDDLEQAMRLMNATLDRKDFALCVALGAAARIKHGNLQTVLELEAAALDGLGFRQQAAFRRAMQ